MDEHNRILTAVHGGMVLVSRETNPLYWDLINTFGQCTGIPMPLNTSFNENEIIVCALEQAILRRVANANACFLRTDMDVLVLGRYYLAKKIAVQALTLKKFDNCSGSVIYQTIVCVSATTAVIKNPL
ncbi:MAG: carbamoyltransferase C-terminal domain-containing protein [Rivularia sp. (in: cyanobacteria)]